jgi:hypothetical protein
VDEYRLLRWMRAGCCDGCGQVMEMDEGRLLRWMSTGFWFICHSSLYHSYTLISA